MALMQEAMTREDWERKEKGLPPIKKEKIVRPEPEHPKVERLVTCSSVPFDRFVRIISSKRNNLKNKDGVRFIGFDVEIEVKYKIQPKKADSEEAETKEPKENYVIAGWMPEGEWLQLLRSLRNKIDLSMLQM